jgi:hypothetical protein
MSVEAAAVSEGAPELGGEILRVRHSPFIHPSAQRLDKPLINIFSETKPDFIAIAFSILQERPEWSLSTADRR